MKPNRASAWLSVATLVAITVLLGLWGRGPVPARASADLDPTAIAVLPFEPETPDAGPPSMRMGLPEILNVRLSLVPGLAVRPMSQVLALGPPRDPVRIGRAVGAMTVMGGSYACVGGAVRIKVQLTDAETGEPAWSHEVRVDEMDYPAAEEALAREVVGALMAQPQGSLPAEAPQAPAETPSGRFLRLVGSGHLASMDSASARESLELLEAALRASPSSAPVNAALAEACAGVFLGGAPPDALWLDRAQGLARRAIWLDEAHAAGHLALARARRLQGQSVEAAHSLIDALRIDPASGPALRLLGILVGGCDDARLVHAVRERLRIASPGTEPGWLDVMLAIRGGSTADLMTRYREEIEAARRSGASVQMRLGQLGALYAAARDTAGLLRTIAELDAGNRRSGFSDSLRLHAMALMGDLRGMRRVIETAHESFTSQDEQALWVGVAWALAGRREEALEWIERAVRLGTSDAWTLDHDPRLAGLRQDPRFQRAAATARRRAEEIALLVRGALQL